MCIFAVASTIPRQSERGWHSLWIASKCVSLQWQAQFPQRYISKRVRCELLQNVYLCSGKHNKIASVIGHSALWIASKCVSLQWQAQSRLRWVRSSFGCELLQNVYLCSGKHNRMELRHTPWTVVNCFKMCIFAVASTMFQRCRPNAVCCELLQNVYLCSGKHNSCFC